MRQHNKKYKTILVFIIVLSLGILCQACNVANNSVEVSGKDKVSKTSIPDLLPESIFRPVIKLETKDKFSAGTIFAAKFEGVEVPIFITAIHIFGPNGGLKNDIPASELPDVLESIELYDPVEEAYSGLLTKALMLKDSKPLTSTDIAAFVGSSEFNVGEYHISDKLPKWGEPVWLPVINDDSGSIEMQKATVTESYKGHLTYKYDNNFSIRATSGAPILNKTGDVVGINTGAANLKDGSQVGYAVPCTKFKKMIKAALEKNS